MTEILLIVTLNNQFNSTQLKAERVRHQFELLLLTEWNQKLNYAAFSMQLYEHIHQSRITLPKIKVCLWNTVYATSGNKVQKAIFSFKVKVKVTRSLTLVSFERVSLVEYMYARQIWSLYLLRFKSYSLD